MSFLVSHCTFTKKFCISFVVPVIISFKFLWGTTPPLYTALLSTLANI